MKKMLRRLYERIGYEWFSLLLDCFRMVIFFLLVLLFVWCADSFRQQHEIKLYEVHTSDVSYQTSKANRRLKEMVVEENVYYAIGMAGSGDKILIYGNGEEKQCK